MKNKLAYSSEIYLLKIDEILKLENAGNYFGEDGVVILLGDNNKGIPDTLYSGRKVLDAADKSKEKFVEARIAYKDMSDFFAFFVNLIKPLKRKHYVVGSGIYWTMLKDVENKNITRGMRNAQNAYQWSKGKAWSFSEAERKSRYDKLYNSLKEKGYDYNNPILVLLNRKFGVRDQVLQGHHRMGICREVGIEEVSIRFWASPKSPDFMKLVDKFVSNLKRIKK
ncbi:MAG: hypothetical protein LBR70_05555 [Lactobacillaceae bacterium]|jgi:hypothetical protein|nr:hypothetical protein [Lactobacillaceae bacterium]